MAPARRRGANKAKANGNLSLGDLVLAKVKGFPAWPAKISRPEDWEKPPDPKKYFVQFLGTKEIAFVAPADIQAFTNEDKIKLSARCQGKTKYFAQAVKEICAAFDEIQKASGLTDDTDDSRVGSEASSVDGVVSNLTDAIDAGVSNAEKANSLMGNVGSTLERCLQRIDDCDGQYEKLSVSGCPNDSSPILSPVIKGKSSIGAELKKDASKSSLKDASNVNDFKHDDNGHSVLTIGNKPRKLGTGTRRRSEAADDRNRSGGSAGTFLKDESSTGGEDVSRSGEPLKGGKKGKNAFAVESDSSEALKPDYNVNGGKKGKNLLKVRTGLEVKNESQEISVDSEGANSKNSMVPG